uniref:Putative secreted protein n=1 Tax=Amblyomma parvum TaxID=251391 RepID=A0A023G0G1_AMBPA
MASRRALAVPQMKLLLALFVGTQWPLSSDSNLDGTLVSLLLYSCIGKTASFDKIFVQGDTCPWCISFHGACFLLVQKAPDREHLLNGKPVKFCRLFVCVRAHSAWQLGENGIVAMMLSC